MDNLELPPVRFEGCTAGEGSQGGFGDVVLGGSETAGRYDDVALRQLIAK